MNPEFPAVHNPVLVSCRGYHFDPARHEMVGPGSQIVGLGAPNRVQTPSIRAHSTHEYAVRYKVDGERMQLIWEGVAAKNGT
jgi:hypothetical protein